MKLATNNKIEPEDEIPLTAINASKQEEDDTSSKREDSHVIYAPDYNVSKMPKKFSRKINVRDKKTDKYTLKTITVLESEDIRFKREAHKNVRFCLPNIFAFIVFLACIFMWTFGYSEAIYDLPNAYVETVLELTVFYAFGMSVMVAIYILIYYRLYRDEVDKFYILHDETEAPDIEYSKEG